MSRTLAKFNFQDNFVTLIDNALPKNLCDEVISFFGECNKKGIVFDRQSTEKVSPLVKKDESLDLGVQTMHISLAWNMHFKLSEHLTNHFKEYNNKYYAGDSFLLQGLKVQKTEPSGGYHPWHDDGGGNKTDMGCNRAFTFIYFLNDVEEGGETEFLYQRERVKPVKGNAVWFPSCYTHMHRGNPPLSGTKYILTGWFEYNE